MSSELQCSVLDRQTPALSHSGGRETSQEVLGSPRTEVVAEWFRRSGPQKSSGGLLEGLSMAWMNLRMDIDAERRNTGR